MGSTDDADTDVERTHGSFRGRCAMYALISCFEMTNYLTRLAVPYLVAFIVRDQRFSEAQRAMLLNSFTPGYVLTQIPAGWGIQRWGCKPVIAANGCGIVAVMLSLPLAARHGAAAVSACLFAFGVVQSTFAPALWTIKATWIPQGPERAWALMASGMGTTLAKNVAAFLTPLLAGRYGWQSAAATYGGAVGLYTASWLGCATERPKTEANPRGQLLLTPSSQADSSDGDGNVLAKKQHPFSPLQLMRAKPVLANTFLHMQHDLSELQILAAWSPTYYNQVLGVPLASVGAFTFWPMLCALPAKPVVAAWETWMLKRGASLRQIRKAAALIACCVSVPGGLLFAVARRPVLATIGYTVFVFGQVFDAAVVAPNKLDLGGTEGDMPVIASWSSTAAWSSGLLCASVLVALKQWTRSWLPLLLVPLGMCVLPCLCPCSAPVRPLFRY